MKNIIIAGSSRAGKTTLARKINDELNCFVISLDKLVAIFSGAYPQLEIRLNWNRQKTTDNLAPFLAHFLGMNSSSRSTIQGINLNSHVIKENRFVLEGAYFNFDKIESILKEYDIKSLEEEFTLIGLVQNQKKADDFYNDFVKHDTENDWTYNLCDDELQEISKEAVTFSRSMTCHLEKHGFTIYDTSIDREKVFDKIIEDIKEKSI
jgi:hypothetical protein